jgi:hypothetical protein
MKFALSYTNCSFREALCLTNQKLARGGRPGKLMNARRPQSGPQGTKPEVNAFPD